MNDPIKRGKRAKTSKERYSGDYRRNKAGELVKLSDPATALNLGKYTKFFKETGNSRSGARSLKQLGNHYNTQAFKEVILPQLQELNPDTDFFYDGNTYKCGGKMKYAEGGELTQFNEGGTHEQNSEGGIPQGMGVNGQVNRVEEGETKNDDYIYSDRIKLTASHANKYNLPKYIVGKSYSEATKLLDKRFKDREDPASISTKQAFLDRLKESQETKKLETEAKKLGVTTEELSAAKALKADENFSMGGGLVDLSAGIGDILLPGSGSIIKGVATVGEAFIDKAKQRGIEQDNAMKEQGQNMLAEGYNSFADGGIPTKTKGLDLNLDIETASASDIAESALKFSEVPKGQKGNSKDKDSPSKALGIAGLAAGLAPLIGNAIEGSTADLDEPVRYQRAGRTYMPNFADEQGELNAIDQAFSGARDLYASAANGRVGAFRSGILGNAVNKAIARSQAFRRTNEINRMEYKAMNADYGNAVREDADLRNKEIESLRADRAALADYKYRHRAASYEGLGEIGKTLFGVNQAQDMSSYDIFGNKKETKDT